MLSTEKFVSIVISVYKKNNVGYSIHSMDGGYIHDNGTYIEEKSLNITIEYIKKKTIFKNSKYLKKII